MTTKQWIHIGASIGAIVGALLPWVTAGPFSVSGTNGDGKITLIVGIITLLLVFVAHGNISAFAGGAIITAVAVYDLSQISSVAPGPFGLSASPGSGLILTLAAGCVLVGLATIGWLSHYMSAHEFKDA